MYTHYSFVLRGEWLQSTAPHRVIVFYFALHCLLRNGAEMGQMMYSVERCAAVDTIGIKQK